MTSFSSSADLSLPALDLPKKTECEQRKGSLVGSLLIVFYFTSYSIENPPRCCEVIIEIMFCAFVRYIGRENNNFFIERKFFIKSGLPAALDLIEFSVLAPSYSVKNLFLLKKLFAKPRLVRLWPCDEVYNPVSPRGYHLFRETNFCV